MLAGAEPFYAEGGTIGVLLSHGFTGTPMEMRPLAVALAAAGYTVAVPLLPGHGTRPDELASSTANDWVASLEAATTWLRARCDRLFMAGLSMGGGLTLYLAGQHPDRFAGIVPINAAVFINNPDLARLVLAPDAPAQIPWGGGADIKAPGVAVPSYPVLPVTVLKEIFALGSVVEELLPCITCPILAMVSREANLTPPANGAYILSRVASTDKELLWLEESYHVATLDHDRERIVERVLAFIRRLAGSPG